MAAAIIAVAPLMVHRLLVILSPSIWLGLPLFGFAFHPAHVLT